MSKKSLTVFLIFLFVQLSIEVSLPPRHKAGCLLINKNKVYCFGGQSALTNPSYLNDHYALDLTRSYSDLSTLNQAWTSLAPGLEATSDFVMVPSGTTGYFINGGTGSANGKPMQQQSAIYNTITNIWTGVASTNATRSLQQARGAVGAVDTNAYSSEANYVYIWGGVMDPTIGSPNTTYSGSLLVMNTLTGTWNPPLQQTSSLARGPLVWTPRIGHALVNSYRMISVVGGQEAVYDAVSNSYKLRTASMTSIPQFDSIYMAWALANVTGDVPSPRSYHTLSIKSMSVVMYGGINPDTNQLAADEFYTAQFQDGSVKWQRKNVSGGSGSRYGHSAVLFGYETLLVIGGVDGSGTVKSDVGVLSVYSGTWRTSFQPSEYYYNTTTPSSGPTGCVSCGGSGGGSSSSYYGYGSSGIQEAVAAGIGAGGAVLFALIGTALYFVVAKYQKTLAAAHPVDTMNYGHEVTKIEFPDDGSSRPLPNLPASTMQMPMPTTHSPQSQPVGEAANYLQHHATTGQPYHPH